MAGTAAARRTVCMGWADDVSAHLIALVGLPGGGKSTVGRQLARALRLPLIDLDHQIEAQLGTSIREYFDAHGEASFRDIEAEALREALEQQSGVLATGGGAVLRPENRRLLRERSTVFFLRTAPEDLARRLRRDTVRPLLQGHDPLTRLRQLHRERDPLYRETAHYIVETPRPSVSSMVTTILMQLEMAGIVDPSRNLQPPAPAASAATPDRPVHAQR